MTVSEHRVKLSCHMTSKPLTFAAEFGSDVRITNTAPRTGQEYQ